MFSLLNITFASAMETCRYESYSYLFLQLLFTIYTFTYPVGTVPDMYQFILWVQPLLHDRDNAKLL